MIYILYLYYNMCLFCKFKYNKDIKSITYTNDFICDKGCKYLSTLTNLKELDLYNNNINDEGCKYLSTLTNLNQLNLNNNNISDNYIIILDIFKLPYKISNGLKIKLFIMKYYFKFY